MPRWRRCRATSCSRKLGPALIFNAASIYAQIASARESHRAVGEKRIEARARMRAVIDRLLDPIRGAAGLILEEEDVAHILRDVFAPGRFQCGVSFCDHLQCATAMFLQHFVACTGVAGKEDVFVFLFRTAPAGLAAGHISWILHGAAPLPQSPPAAAMPPAADSEEFVLRVCYVWGCVADTHDLPAAPSGGHTDWRAEAQRKKELVFYSAGHVLRAIVADMGRFADPQPRESDLDFYARTSRSMAARFAGRLAELTAQKTQDDVAASQKIRASP